MILTKFRWWLSDAISNALNSLSETIGTAIEENVETVFLSGKAEHATETGLVILWNSVAIKPAIDDSLKKAFLQQYKNFIATAGKKSGTTIIENFIPITAIDSIDMRDHPDFSSLYPFHYVRVYISVVDDTVLAQAKELLAIFFPARCSRHFAVLQYYDGGFCRRRLNHGFYRTCKAY